MIKNIFKLINIMVFGMALSSIDRTLCELPLCDISLDSVSNKYANILNMENDIAIEIQRVVIE